MVRYAAAVSLLVLAAAPQLSAADRFHHLRSEDADVEGMLTFGYEHSATFKVLVDEIEASPVIVYITRSPKLSGGMEGALLHVMAGMPDMPMLRVVLLSSLGTVRGTAILGHEMQHVVEIMHAGIPHGSREMSGVFAKLDAESTAGTAHFETADAKRVTELVLQEVRHGR